MSEPLFDCYRRLLQEEVAAYVAPGGFTEIPVQREESAAPEHPEIQASGEFPVTTDGSSDWTAYLRVDEQLGATF